MRLLILTQKVDIDDDILGFFHGWILEFAKHCDQVTVVCLWEGRHIFPDNVNVLSLGKNNLKFKISNLKLFDRIKYLFQFYKYIWQERKNYDAVFVHMNQIYVILGGVFWKFFGKKVSLWYTHKQVGWSLRVAEKLVDNIFTASKESFQLISKKVGVVGHGIDTDIFKPLGNKQINKTFKILTVGRISPIKDVKTLVRAVAELQNRNFKLVIVGVAGTNEQEKYFQEVRDLVKEKEIEERVDFVGSMSNREVARYYRESDLFVNMAPTGGLDKAILEAMACGLVVIVANQTMKNDLSEFGDKFIFTHHDYKQLSDKIRSILEFSPEERQKIGDRLRAVVIERHNLSNLVLKILNNINEKASR